MLMEEIRNPLLLLWSLVFSNFELNFMSYYYKDFGITYYKIWDQTRLKGLQKLHLIHHYHSETHMNLSNVEESSSALDGSQWFN